MVIIKPEWVGFEIQLSDSYPDGSQWGMHYDSYEVDHVDTGHSDKVVTIECDGLETTLRTKLSEVEAERDKYKLALEEIITIDIPCDKCEGSGQRDEGSAYLGAIIMKPCPHCDNGKASHVVEWEWDLGVINNSGDMHCSKLLIDHDLRNPDVAGAYHLLDHNIRFGGGVTHAEIPNNKGTLRLRKAK